MLALPSLVLMTTLLPGPSAQAGSWTYIATGDNTGTTFTDNGWPGYVPTYSFKDAQGQDVIQPGSIASLPGYKINRQGNGSSGVGCAINVVIHVQVTFTWHPDPNLPSDPAPDNVWVLESATAVWSANAGDSQHLGYFGGSAANGLGDTEYDPPSMQPANSGTGYSGPPPDQSYSVPPSIAQHYKSYPAGGGTITVDQRTVTASASTSYANFNQWYYGAKATVFYSASIHPTPYNFHRVNFYGTPPTSSVLVGAGDLRFHYEWDSTSGYLAANGSHPDLSGIEIHENVDAPSSPTSTDANGVLVYETDTPPFFWNPPVHFDAVTLMANAPALGDHNSWGATEGASLSSSFQPPYKADSFNETQTFKFYDPDIMAAGVEQIIPGNAGPFTIKEAVIADSNSPSGYSYQVTKDGQQSLLIPLP